MVKRREEDVSWKIWTKAPNGDTFTIRCDTKQQVARDYRDLRARGREVQVQDRAGRPVELGQFGIRKDE